HGYGRGGAPSAWRDAGGRAEASSSRERAAQARPGNPKKSSRLLRQGEMTVFEYIEAEKASYSVTELSRVLGVSRSGFHKWSKASPSQRRRDDERLGAEIRAIHRRSRERYGSPRVHAELRAQGRNVGRKRVARLMGESGLKGLARRRFRRTTDSA